MVVDTLKRIVFKREWEGIAERERGLNAEVNGRVAATLAKMDPFEPLMREFHGVFSEEFAHPEDRLDEKGQLLMKTWAWQNRDHPAFKWITDWVMNVQGNETLKHAPVTEARILYGRAQISATALFVNEVKRLAALYEDMLEKQKPTEFDSTVAVE